MKPVKRYRGTQALYILMAFFILGASSSSPEGGVEAAAWKTLTIPAAACIPKTETQNYVHATGYVECDGASCTFICPFQFPTELDVTVRRFSLMAFDNSTTYVRAVLYKAKPGKATAVSQAVAITTNSESDPQTQTDTSIDSRVLTSYNGSFIRLVITGSDKRVYGFRIKYSNWRK